MKEWLALMAGIECSSKSIIAPFMSRPKREMSRGACHVHVIQFGLTKETVVAASAAFGRVTRSESKVALRLLHVAKFTGVYPLLK
jgi:hypothetical protein